MAPAVWARRIGDGAVLNRMLIVSVVLHTFLLALLFLSPSLPTRKWTFGPVYTVDLVSLPAEYLDKKAATPVFKEVATIRSRDHAVAMKKVLEAPIKRLAPLKRETSSELEKAIEGVRKKVETSSARQTTPVPREGVAETNRAVNAYYEALWSRIKAEWALPRGILPSENLEAVIDVALGRSGNVTSLGIEKGSGNRFFDQSAIRAIRKASPFPPIPDSIRGSEIELGIRFHSSQFR